MYKRLICISWINYPVVFFPSLVCFPVPPSLSKFFTGLMFSPFTVLITLANCTDTLASSQSTCWSQFLDPWPANKPAHPFCHDACHVPGLAPIFLFSITITPPSFPPVCALEGLLFCDVIALTHICVPLLRPMTVILGLTHPSSLIYDMTSSSLTRCILSCLWFVLSYLALDPPYSSPFSETCWTLFSLWFADPYLWLVLMTRPFDSDSSWPLTHTARPCVYKE